MVKQLKVDVEKSLGYKSNGRLKKAGSKETANYNKKKFLCPNCNYEEEIGNIQFGEYKECPQCQTVMLEVTM